MYCAKKSQVGMSRSLPPLNALRAFEAAGRHQSFSRAAEELGVSHSAISRHVRGLEDRLGVHLFRDMSRGVELTADGRAYMQRVTPALDAIGEATELLAERPAGLVTVSSEPLFATKAVIPRLSRFFSGHPDIELRLDATYEIADLARYEADIAIRFAERGYLDEPADLLSVAPLSVYAAPGLVAGGAITEADLERCRLYADRDESIWNTWCEAAGFATRPGTYGNWRMRPTYALEAALNGHGLFLGALDSVEHDLATGRLIQVSPVTLQDGAFYLVYGTQAARRKAVRLVREWLLDETRHLRSGQKSTFWLNMPLPGK